jgi:oxygen-independent coproporphyrinogen-3 oxidase
MPSTIAPAPSISSRAASNWQEAGFAVYVHWPFCQAKCPYCDFNSHVAGSVDDARWAAALAAELRRAAEATSGRTVGSVFFGGGTPSLMAPATVGAVLEAVGRNWSLAPDVEVTLEANPTSADAARFAGYRAAGVNRLSVGVQALVDRDLRRLGRLHSAAEAKAALDLAQATFDAVSADLIYARQDQTIAAWRAELGEMLSRDLDHLSLYQLTIEPGTVFGARARRGLLPGLPDEDLGAELYEITQDLCDAAGLPAYEISNHARAGRRARHNMTYWRAGDWIGVGPGAVGRVSTEVARRGSEAPKGPSAWLAAAETPGGATTWSVVGDHGLEYLMMCLRLAEGVSIARLARLGVALPPARIEELRAEGYLDTGKDRIAATPKGRVVLDAILRQLV